ncbi:hypothetical protein DFR33_103130 [Bradymonas sediminis]|nr:hypothetical protein DFR33_103130 [Bradymonas sediminis]
MDYQRAYASVLCRLAALALGVSWVGAPGLVQAQDALSEDVFGPDATAEDAVHMRLSEVRRYQLPDGLAPGELKVASGVDGRTLYAATTGLAAAEEGGVQEAACTIVEAQEDGARAISFRFQDKPTGCVGVIAHPDGGFFVRGTHLTVLNLESVPAERGGFTARIDAAGREVWALADQTLLEATRVADGGTGEFMGRYIGASPTMAFNPQTNRLLAFSNGELSAGDSRRLTQAHVIDANSGELRTSGLGFGIQDSGTVLKTALYRAAQNDFLIHFQTGAGTDNPFFSYNGRRSIDAFEPAGKQWRERDIPEVVLSADQSLYILSRTSKRPDADAEVSAYNAQGNLLWSVVLAQDSGPTSPGAAENIWLLKDHILVGFPAPIGTALRVLERASGEQVGQERLGVNVVFGQIAYQILGIAQAAQASASLISAEPQTRIMREDRIEILSGPPTPNDANDADAGAGEPGGPQGSGESGGCAVAKADALPPLSGLSLAFAVLVFTIANRRRTNCVYSGE